MSIQRLRARAPSAQCVGRALLPDYRLAFDKVGLDGSGKCHIVRHTGSSVYGVLFALSEDDKARLDELEMTGFGYLSETVTLRLEGEQDQQATAYIATRVRPGLKPYTWYKQHVVCGARDARLPTAYVSQLETVQALEDPDQERASRELGIYPLRKSRGEQLLIRRPLRDARSSRYSLCRKDLSAQASRHLPSASRDGC